MDNVNPLTLTVPAGAGGSNIDKGIPNVETCKYTTEELKFRSNMIARLMQMRFMRDKNHPELDNMSYIQYYESNRRKDLSFLIPRKNRQDLRIVTGTTRKKDTTLLTTALDLNLNPAVTAFDVDGNFVNEFGDNMSDHVKKSREIEDWDEIRPSIYRELISQGDVFVQDIHVERFRDMPIHKMDWDPCYDPISKFDVRRRLEKVFDGCKVRMINGKKIYLGNIRCENIKDQPIVCILNIYPRTIAASIYGQWERWKHVPYKIETINTFWDDGKTYKDWNLVQLSDYDKVAEVMVFDPILNQYQIFLNGVMMLPINYPLSYISPSGEINIAQGKFETITDFCYSKSQPANIKVDQEVKDETIKIIIEKMRQSWKPPKGTSGQTVYSDKIFMAGQMTQNMRAGEVFDLIQSPGATAADFSFFKLISEAIDEKTTDKNFTGSGDQKQTATEAVQDQNNQMKSLGLTIDGIVNLEKRLTWLRIYNILEHWTKPLEPGADTMREGVEEMYKNFSVDTSLEDGSSGTKMFRYTTGKLPSVEDQQDEEDKLSKKHGKQIRIVYMNPELMRTLKHFWFIVMNPSPKSNDHLSQLMFTNNIREAMELFGPQSLNMEYLKQRYATKIKESYEKFFLKTPAGQTGMPGMGMVGPDGQPMMPGQGQSGGQGKKPSLGMATGGNPMKAMMGQQ